MNPWGEFCTQFSVMWRNEGSKNAQCNPKTCLLMNSNKVGERGKEPLLCKSIRHQPALWHRFLVHQTSVILVLSGSACVSTTVWPNTLKDRSRFPTQDNGKVFQDLSMKLAGVSKTYTFLQELLSNFKWKTPKLDRRGDFEVLLWKEEGQLISFLLHVTHRWNSVFLLPLQCQTESIWGRRLCLAGGTESAYRC